MDTFFLDMDECWLLLCCRELSCVGWGRRVTLCKWGLDLGQDEQMWVLAQCCKGAGGGDRRFVTERPGPCR